MAVHDGHHLAQVFRRSVVLRVQAELFPRLAGRISATDVLLPPAGANHQAAGLARVLLGRMRLNGAQDLLTHGQLRAIRDTAGKPPKGN